MQEKTLRTKIRDLPTTGNSSGLIRQLAGVSGQKYRDAHRAFVNAAEGDNLNLRIAKKHISEQQDAVHQFVEEFGEMTVGDYLDTMAN